MNDIYFMDGFSDVMLVSVIVSCLGFKHLSVMDRLALVLLDKNGLLVVSPHVLLIQST